MPIREKHGGTFAIIPPRNSLRNRWIYSGNPWHCRQGRLLLAGKTRASRISEGEPDEPRMQVQMYWPLPISQGEANWRQNLSGKKSMTDPSYFWKTPKHFNRADAGQRRLDSCEPER